ncbi:MAG: DUF6691 family protein, partial [Bacteriovoracaceae bacterium]
RKPLYSESHYLPSVQDLDLKLILGASLFGFGWGLLGVCPGPGIVNLATLDSNAVLFVISMTTGMAIFKGLEKAKIL